MELRDADLVLRPPRPDDVDGIVAACSDDEIARFIPLMPSPYERSDAQRWIRRCKQVWAHGSAYPFVIAAATADRLLGAIELRPGDGSVGYWVDASARGRGVATRALRLVCEWHAERPLHLVTHPDNAGSQRVAEKAGFHRAGLQPTSRISATAPLRRFASSSTRLPAASRASRGRACAAA